MTQIHYTTDYDKFKFFDCNRNLSQSHICTLKNDPTFPEQFSKHPIIVDKNFKIIDGQHRFKAAKFLEIPIYYIVDENADEYTIMKLNAQQQRWMMDDYIKFHSTKKNKEYMFIEQLHEKTAVPYNHLLKIISSFFPNKRAAFTKNFKEGNIKIDELKKESIREFLEYHWPIINQFNYRKSDYRFLCNANYTQAFYDFFIEDNYKYKKFMSEIKFRCVFLNNHSSNVRALKNIQKASTRRKIQN